MRAPATVRLFIALWPPDPVREAIARWQAQWTWPEHAALVKTDRLHVTPPSWRPDLTDPADLVEEVTRLDGYDKVPSILPVARPGTGLTPGQRRRRGVGLALAEAGFVEVLSYPFVGESTMDALGIPGDDPRRHKQQRRKLRGEREGDRRAAPDRVDDGRLLEPSPRPVEREERRCRHSHVGRGQTAVSENRRRDREESCRRDRDPIIKEPARPCPRGHDRQNEKDERPRPCVRQVRDVMAGAVEDLIAALPDRSGWR